MYLKKEETTGPKTTNYALALGLQIPIIYQQQTVTLFLELYEPLVSNSGDSWVTRILKYSIVSKVRYCELSQMPITTFFHVSHFTYT